MVEDDVAPVVVGLEGGVVTQGRGGHEAYLRERGKLGDGHVDGGVAGGLALVGVGKAAEAGARPRVLPGALGEILSAE